MSGFRVLWVLLFINRFLGFTRFKDYEEPGVHGDLGLQCSNIFEGLRYSMKEMVFGLDTLKFGFLKYSCADPEKFVRGDPTLTSFFCCFFF